MTHCPAPSLPPAGRFTPLEEKLKRVMEQELKTIVQEERYVRGDGGVGAWSGPVVM